MSVITDEDLAKMDIDDDHGVHSAGLVLQWLKGRLDSITADKRFPIPELPDKKKEPHLYLRTEKFIKYAESLPPNRFVPNWWKFIGGIAVPDIGHNGQIHLYALDDGLLSDSTDAPPDIPYDHRSSFFLNHVLGGGTGLRKIKGKIHLHPINIFRLKDERLTGIKQFIANEHQARGNFIPRTSMFNFTLRELCPNGQIVFELDFLSRPVPEWFATQIPKWKS